MSKQMSYCNSEDAKNVMHILTKISNGTYIYISTPGYYRENVSILAKYLGITASYPLLITHYFENLINKCSKLLTFAQGAILGFDDIKYELKLYKISDKRYLTIYQFRSSDEINWFALLTSNIIKAYEVYAKKLHKIARYIVDTAKELEEIL